MSWFVLELELELIRGKDLFGVLSNLWCGIFEQGLQQFPAIGVQTKSGQRENGRLAADRAGIAKEIFYQWLKWGKVRLSRGKGTARI